MTQMMILCLDEGLTTDDDLLDQQIAGMALRLLEGHPHLPAPRLRLAAAFVRAALRLSQEHDMGEGYYDFLARALQTVMREIKAVRQWAEAYLGEPGA
jgi:hypothetical protein